MWPNYYGTALTAVPTFTFSAGSPAATAIMNFSITGFTTGTAGVSYVGAGGAIFGGIVAGSAANTNPITDKLLSIPRVPPITVAATTGVPTLAGPYGGVNFQSVPTYAAYSSCAAPGTAAVITVDGGRPERHQFPAVFLRGEHVQQTEPGGGGVRNAIPQPIYPTDSVILRLPVADSW